MRAKRAAAAKRNTILAAVAGATALSMLSAAAHAGTTYTWTSTAPGTYQWDDATNWGGAGFPNLATDSAILNVNLAGNINVAMPLAGATTGSLSLGGTGAAVTTDIGNANSAGSVLVMDNTGGANNSDGSANASITSAGTIGSVNLISAPLALNQNTNIVQASVNGLTINSLVALTTTGTAQTRTLNNNLTGNLVLNLGGITSLSTGTLPTANITNVVQLGELNNSTTTQWGTININGPITNGAQAGGFNVSTQVIFGAGGANNANTFPTININAANTYSGGARLFRANLFLGTDSAFGTGSLQWGGGAASGSMGYNFYSTDDARNIANTTTMQRNLTIRGDHSLTMSGTISQSNASNLYNLLPAGKTFNITNNLATDTSGTGRTFTFDGTGRTNVSGNIIDNTADTGSTGVVQKNGDGVVVVSSAASTYHGSTVGNGGLLDFTSAAGYGNTSSVVINNGGAVGVDTGSTAAAFTAKFVAAAQPSTGSVALAPADAAVNIDYTSGDFSSANMVNTSLGAVLGGTTYTGTITPAPANGYRLGGGTTLTLPNANALTGANNLTATNGGAVALTNTNNYTGNTAIKGNWIVSTEQLAAANIGITSGTGSIVPTGVYQPTVLSVSKLADGASSLGNPTDTSAANLSVSGGTLKYVGSTNDSSNRLFTIGTLGATLDSSGSGAVSFTNTGNNVSADVTGTITGNLTTSGNNITAVSDVSQLSVGMTVAGGDLPVGTTITGIRPTLGFSGANPQAPAFAVTISANAVTAQTGATLTFGNQNRTLNLTGSNTGNNTIAGGLADSATGKLSVAKSGAGTWVLSGTQSYSGNTTVSAGTLHVANNLTSTASVGVTGGTLKLDSNGSFNRVIKTPSVAVTGTGKLNLDDNKLATGTAVGTWNGTAYDGVSGMVASGYGVNQDFTGTTGIITTQSNATGGNTLTNIGVASNTDLGLGTFGGVSVGANDTLVMYTYGGDANLDGIINGDDYFQIDSATASSHGWFNGDFNYDGVINGDDYFLIDQNFAAQGAAIPTSSGIGGGLAGVTAVPEPASIGLIGLAATGLLGRRRRRV